MKRLIVLTILVTTAISTTGCRRWGLRGARCGAPAPTYTPVPVYMPAPACPPVACPPVTCPTTYDVCPTVPYSSGYGGVIGGAVIDGGTYSAPSTVIQGSGAAFQAPTIEGHPGPSFDRSTLNVPGGSILPGGHPGVDLTRQVVPNKPIFSHVVGDRKLESGETINREYELPVESAAAAATSEKK